MRYLFIFVGLLATQAFAQNLNDERIWKLVSRKKSIYLSHGVFHQNQGPATKVTAIRSSWVPDRGYERVVIDFEGPAIPRLYGHISEGEQKISIDFFNTGVQPALKSLANTKYVKAVDFLAIEKDQLTMEMQLKQKLNYDVFFLESPGRLVIDIRP